MSEDQGFYGPYMVLCSAAGYYVGTQYHVVKNGVELYREPGSRESDYFRTKEAAEAYLAEFA